MHRKARPQFDPKMIEALQVEGLTDLLPVSSRRGVWKFRLRTRALSFGEKKILGALSKLGDKTNLIQHWAVEVINGWTGESFLYELSKNRIGNSNELKIHHLDDGAHLYNDRWKWYGFGLSKVVQGRIGQNMGPDDIRQEALDILKNQPTYHLLIADCIAFATTLMQRISACEEVNKTFREIIGVDPHHAFPNAAKFLGRVSTLVYPKLYAATAVPRSTKEPHLIRQAVQRRVRKGTESYLGYYGALGLSYGVGYAGEAVYQVGHASKVGVDYVSGFWDVIRCRRRTPMPALVEFKDIEFTDPDI